MRPRFTPIYPSADDGRLMMAIIDHPARMVLVARLRASGAMVHWEQHPGMFWRTHWKHEERSRLVSSFITASLAKASPGSGGRYDDPEARAAYPALIEFLTCSQLPGGVARQTSTLSVFGQDGLFKCFLNDRDTQKAVCIASRTLAGLWPTLELCLVSDDPGWRDLVPHGNGRNGTKRTRGV